MTFHFKIIEDDSVPEGTVKLVPHVETTYVTFAETGETRRYVTWDSRQAAINENVDSKSTPDVEKVEK